MVILRDAVQCEQSLSSGRAHLAASGKTVKIPRLQEPGLVGEVVEGRKGLAGIPASSRSEPEIGRKGRGGGRQIT